VAEIDAEDSRNLCPDCGGRLVVAELVETGTPG
jgi:hypothetical protein